MTRSSMPQPAQGVYRRSDSTNWQWRIKVPQDLKHLYDGKQWAGGCSLKTSDLRDANRLAADLRSEWLNRFDQQRKQLAPKQVDRITPDLAHFLAGTALHGVLQSNEAFRCTPSDQERLLGWMRSMGMPGADTARDLIAWTGGADSPPLDPLGGMPEPLAQMLSKLHLRLDEEVGRALATGNLRKALPGMQYVAQRHGIVFDENTPGAAEGLWTYLRAIKKATEGKVKRDKGEVVETPPAPSLKQAAGTPKTRCLRNVFDRYKVPFMPTVEGAKVPDHIRDMDAWLTLYEKHTGNPALNELTRDQGEAFQAWLLQDRSDVSRTKKDWSSKRKHMVLDGIKTLLNHAEQNLDWIVKNPWRGLDIPYRTENKRRPMYDAELTAIFGLPLFTEYALPNANKMNGGAAAYWLPLLGLYTGARVGELCQLRADDVFTVEGVPVISINDEAEEATVKTDAGIRQVPVHPELLRLGFLEYVDAMREAGEEWLWPALGLREGKPGTYFSRWFSDTVKKTLPEDTKKLPTFHYFRHGVQTKLARARVPTREIRAIIGHEQQGVGDQVYTEFAPDMLLESVKKIDYPVLHLPRVYNVETEAVA